MPNRKSIESPAPDDVTSDLGMRVDEIHRINRLWHLMQEVAGPTSQRAIRLRTIKDALQLDLLEYFRPWISPEPDGVNDLGEVNVLLCITVATTSYHKHACHIPQNRLADPSQTAPNPKH